MLLQVDLLIHCDCTVECVDHGSLTPSVIGVDSHPIYRWSDPVPGRDLHPLKSSAFSRRTITPTSPVHLCWSVPVVGCFELFRVMQLVRRVSTIRPTSAYVRALAARAS